MLKKLDEPTSMRIKNKIQELVTGQPNVDVKKMIDESLHRYRLRCGDYRIVFDVKNELITILIVRIGHRRNVYQGL